MRNFFSISLLCLLCCTAFAGNADAKFFLTLYATGGEHSFADEQEQSSGVLSGVKLSLDFEGGKTANDFSLEGTFNRFSADSRVDGSGFDAAVTRLDIIYPLMKKTDWRPFLTVGIGRMFFDGGAGTPQDEDIIAYGAGLKYLLNEYLTLRAEGRHELLFNREDGNIDNYEYTASVGYTFGKRKPRVKKPKPQPKPQPEPQAEPQPSDDDDRDGVKNPVDRCPGTPPGIRVDGSGCAEQTPDRPDPPAEEAAPEQQPQATPVEERTVAAATPAAAPAISEPAPLQEETVREPAKPAVVPQETPPAYVLPALPTVIAIQTLPPDQPAEATTSAEPSTAAAARQTSEPQPSYTSSEATTGRILSDAPAESFDQLHPADSPPDVAATASASDAIATAPRQPLPLTAPGPTAISSTAASAAATAPASAAALESSTPPPVLATVPDPATARTTATELPAARAATTTISPKDDPAVAAAGDTPMPAGAAVAEQRPEAQPARSVRETAAEQRLAVTASGPARQDAPQAVPITIPQCSGLPPHALLMLGNSGSELLQIPVDAQQKQPEPYRADARVARKSHIPTASFGFDVWSLAPQAKQVLSLLVQQLQDSELDFSIRVEGHTDSLGSETYNDRLSLRRAEAVADFLKTEQGIDPARLKTVGCGETHPLASNETDEGRRLNRRFELVILPFADAR